MLYFTLLLHFAFAASPVLATVNGVPITQADLDTVLASLPADVLAQTANNPGVLVDQLVKSELVRQEAEAAKLGDTEAGRAALAAAARQALVNLQIRGVVAERTSPGSVKAWYEAHKAQYAAPAARARHIMVGTEAEAKKVVEDLAHGADFAKLAAERSLDPGSAAEGGELGWFSRNMMVKPFADAVFTVKAGTLAGPVQSEYGWHVIEVEAFREGTPLEEVADAIRAEMEGTVMDDYLAELEAKATIVRSGGAANTPVTALASGPDLPNDAPSAGVKGAPLQVVVFLDLECPHCAAMHEALARLLKSRTDIEVFYRHYPVNSACNADVSHAGHPFACTAASAVVCAGKNGAVVMDELLSNHAALSEDVIRYVASAHGGGNKKWDACMADPKTAERIAVDVASGRALGVEGTPTVYFGTGGKWWRLDGTAEQLGAALDAIKPTK